MSIDNIPLQAEESAEWITLGNLDDFANESITQSALPSGFPLAIYRVNDEFFVTADRCTHGAASLAEEGELRGYVIECAWHNGTFDIRTGAALTLPCRAALMTYPVKIDGQQLLLYPKPNKRHAPT